MINVRSMVSFGCFCYLFFLKQIDQIRNENISNDDDVFNAFVCHLYLREMTWTWKWVNVNAPTMSTHDQTLQNTNM